MLVDLFIKFYVQVREVKEKNNMKEESKGETLEGANDPVTLGDRLSNQAMTASFRASFPNVPVSSNYFFSVKLFLWYSTK